MSLRFSVVLFLLTLCTTSVRVVSEQHGHGNHDHSSGESRLDPFEEISHASFLPVQEFESFIDTLFDNLICDSHDHDDHQDDSSHEQCEESLCINAEELIEFIGGNSSLGITEDQFGNASIILLYLATELDHHCHEKVNVSHLSLEAASSRLLNLTYAASPDHRHIHTSGMKALFDTFKASINHESHDHDEDHTDHTDEHSDEDHDHDHEGEGHSDEDAGHHTDHSDEESDEDHDHEGEGHSDEDASHHTDHSDEESGEEHDHGDHEHSDHGRMELVVQASCLSPDAVLYYMGKEASDFIESDQLGHFASLIVFLLSQGADVQESCRLLPQQTDFIRNLFSNFDGNSSHVTIEGLEEMMTLLAINPEASGHGDSHAGHDHRRKRRSAHAWSNRLEANGDPLNRVKRQASKDNQFTQCYSAEQLAALYDSTSLMDVSVFQQLCPSLISQRLYGVCTTETTKSDISDAEKYGYSSLAVFIICLCSILGVVIIPCTSHKMYDGIMAIFLGLAVGTLFADAILHLIPSVFGVHGHEDGHDHGSDIVVEEFAQYGLVIMAALYFFYVLELAMSACGGHSHGDEKSNSFNSSDHENVNNIRMNTMNGDGEKGKKYTVSGPDVKSNDSSAQHTAPSQRFLGMSPVAFMIVIGDAIHNCADGLVIGASFSQGQISTGIATSIAVLCHELPHELGDFAVLLQSGCSFGKAVFLNLLSSLTAFIGLYIGLSVSTDSSTERWIMAVASGMFIYIALVDLLPQLVRARGLNVVFHNIGILVGFAIMLLLVVFEEHIEV